MKHFILIIAAFFAVASFIASCSSTETYAEQRQKELDAISNFIANHGIKVITKAQFEAKGCKTDSNEYVLFNNSGVYMNIVNKGTDGSPLEKSQSATVLSRFYEVNINASTKGHDSVTLSNLSGYFVAVPDRYSVRNTSGTYTASFTQGAMYYYYGASVPGGWLVPLKYINLGRGDNKYIKKKDGTDSLDASGNKIPGSVADVKLIVPHDQGTSTASSSVIACWYELTYQLADNQ